MLPYISSTSYHFLGLSFQTWGTFVALGFLIGTYVAWRRAKNLGLKADAIPDIAFWILISAFICARLFHAFFYDPLFYLAHPFSILDPRRSGYAMFGGLIGAVLAGWTYLRKKRLTFLAYADALIFGLPWGIGIGRLGCFLIHDHPGIATTFFLGVRYPDGLIRHDLGLYDSLIGFATGLLFLILNRWKRAPGFWLGSFCMIEGLSRFLLDFLRIADVQYFGLTPTQYLAAPLFFVGAWLVGRAGRPPLCLPLAKGESR
jgi:phosphatidylglycerol:prolipoprotein diacylglycerol transferase